MIISRAFAWACLSILGWALLFVAALLALLIVVQYLRADVQAQPMTHFAAALVSAGLALICRLIARRLI